MYCSSSDLQKYYSPVDNYDLKMDMPNFEFVDQGSDVFQLNDAGAVIVAYRDGLDLGAAAATVGAISSENDWFYDSALDRFTIKLGSSEVATDYRFQRAPMDWADSKTEACEIGSNQVNQFLDVRFPRPLPKISDNETDAEYDQAVVEMTAILACVHLIKSSGSEDWVDLEARVFNEDGTGILDRLNKGEIKLSFELTKSDEGAITEVTTDASTTGYLTDAIGTASVDGYEVYLVKISVAGTLTAGTINTDAKYVVTDSQGNEIVASTLITGLYQTIGGGMSARWTPGVYKENDLWTLKVQTKGVDTSDIGVIRMVRR